MSITINDTVSSNTATTNAEPVPVITVFSKNECSACDHTKTKLTEYGIPYREFNVQEDSKTHAEFGNRTAFDHVVERYGRQMPVVVVQDGTWGDHWAGRRPDKLVELKQIFGNLNAAGVREGCPAQTVAL